MTFVFVLHVWVCMLPRMCGASQLLLRHECSLKSWRFAMALNALLGHKRLVVSIVAVVAEIVIGRAIMASLVTVDTAIAQFQHRLSEP